MQTLRIGGLVAAAAAVVVAGCGDGKICQSEVLVDIRSPVGPVLVDSNPTMAGVQTTVAIRSTVGRGETVVVELLDAAGEVIAEVTAETDADGDVTIDDVTVDGAVALRASIDAGECGRGDDQVDLDVALGRDCAVTIRQTPIDNDFYAPLGVLNRSNDPDPDLPNFQADLDVHTVAGYEVELFVLGDVGQETSAGTAAADDGGVASFALALGQGRQSVRAVCSAATGAATASLTTTVFVDTEAPACAVTFPVPGTTITPALDDGGDVTDGIQLTVTGRATGGDVAGEAARFVVTVDGAATTIDGSPLTADGTTSAAADLAPAATPATASIRLTTQDHAGNACDVAEAYDIVYDGCAIAVVAPSGTVTADADGDPVNGAQIDVVLAVDTACAGQVVTSACGLDDPSGVVADDGTLTLTVDWCATTPCDRQDTCTFTVTSPAGIETQAAVDVDYDDQAPAVAVQIVEPALGCGAQVTPAIDIDAAAPGVQVRLRVLSPLATTRRLEQTDGGGTQSFDATTPPGDVVVTLAPGTTTFVGFATDDVGNTARSAACALTLTDIVVSFLPPAADGAVGGGDGVLAGTDLTFPLCGRVSELGATVTVSVDGGPALAAAVSGLDWCVTLTLAQSPPSYAIVATATAGPLAGQATLVLAVDLVAPDPVGDLAVRADTRQSLTATWTAPADGGAAAAGYLVKVATSPLTDANFDVTGELVPMTSPRPPGSAERLRIAPRRPGVAYWVAVAAVDDAGNRAPAAVVGPVTPAFDPSGAIGPPDAGPFGALFGLELARGKFNDDDYWDVAVGAPGAQPGAIEAPGAVYVYFGSADGLADVPDVVIEGRTPTGALGLALTAVRWSSATRDDLVIGEPYAANVDGRVHVFRGGAGFTAGTYSTADADLVIGVHPVPNRFTTGGLGWSLATLDFDGDGRQDLAIGDANGDGGSGAVAVIYGGTVTAAQVLLSDTDPSQLGGAVVDLIRDPDPTVGDVFGMHVFNVGPTMGPADRTDDLLIGYYYGFDHLHVGQPNRVLLYRGTTGRPTTPGVYPRTFTINRDVRIDYPTTDGATELGAAAGSIADVNGDGARDLVLGLYRDGADAGRVLIVDGNTMGTGGIASTATPGVTVTTITAGAGVDLVGAGIVNNAASPGADVDGDGVEDLVITARTAGGAARLLVWFGGDLPIGATTTASAAYTVDGPATFDGDPVGFGGTPHSAIWAGDVNGDGLADISWGDGTGNAGNGAFEILWDDGL
jgi:hypothetical protein